MVSACWVLALAALLSGSWQTAGQACNTTYDTGGPSTYHSQNFTYLSGHGLRQLGIISSHCTC